VVGAGDVGDKGGVEKVLTGGSGRRQRADFGEGRTGGASSGRSVLTVMRRMRGSRVCAHRRWGCTRATGIRLAAEGHGGWLELPWMAVFQ
jgi:hypothetical protein